MTVVEPDDSVTWACWLRTLFAASGALMMYVFTGFVEAHSAVLSPQLKQKDSPIHITMDDETWIASLGILTSPISAILTGPAIDAFGRKKGMQLFYLCMGLGFGIISCATEVAHIYIGRSVCAFALGMEVVAVVYLAEITTKTQRSFFLAVLSCIFSAGLTVTNILGGYLPWKVASAIFSVASFVYFIVPCFAPESPAWLYKTGNLDASSDSLRRLGRSPAGTTAELEMLKLASKEETEQFNIRTFFEPTVWKPFFIMFLFHFLHCACGVYHVMFYTIDFIERLGTGYDPLTLSIILSTARCLGHALIGVFCTTAISRRFSTAFSAFWMTVAFVGLGVYEWSYRDMDPTARPWQWLPITLMVVNIVAGIMGVTTLPWLMTGEVFPLRVRGAMNGASYVIGTGWMFVFIKLYDVYMDVFRMSGIFFAYAAASFVLIFFAIFVLPETQNKTLYEVEQRFLPKDKRQSMEQPKKADEEIS